MRCFTCFALLFFACRVQSIRNLDELDANLTDDQKEWTSSEVDVETDTTIFGPPLEVVEWDLPAEFKPPHKIQKCITSPKFKVTTNNGFRFFYCSAGRSDHSSEDSTKSSLYFSGDDGLTLTYQLMCDGELLRAPMTKFLDNDLGYGYPKFADANKCSKVGVTVYRISGYRQTWDLGGKTSATTLDSKPFGLGEVKGWRLQITVKDDKFGLYLVPPSTQQVITVEFFLLLGAKNKAVQRHKSKLTHTFEPGKGGWGFATFGEMPIYSVGVEILSLWHDGIAHHIQDWEDPKISKDDERIMHATIEASEKAEVLLRETAESVEKTRKEFIEALETGSETD